MAAKYSMKSSNHKTSSAPQAHGHGARPIQRILFLAQLPPPTHGVTAMSERVMHCLKTIECAEIEHLWQGGSKNIRNIGGKSISKLFGFAWLIARLALKWLGRAKYDAAYLCLAPRGNAALRDALLIGLAKRLAGRPLVHVHTDGLHDILHGQVRTMRFIRWLISDVELIAITGRTVEVAERSAKFKAVHFIANCVPDPGDRVRRFDGSRLNISILANLDRRKGSLRFVDALANACAIGLPVQGHVAGADGPTLTNAQLKLYMDERAKAVPISVHGPIDGTAKAEFFNTCDIFLYPTLHDLAPLVILEAMAYGAVPIAFDTGGIAEMLGPSLAHNIIDGSQHPCKWQAQILQRLAAYARGRTDLERDSHSARNRYLDHYSPHAFSHNFQSIIEGAENRTSKVDVPLPGPKTVESIAFGSTPKLSPSRGADPATSQPSGTNL